VLCLDAGYQADHEFAAGDSAVALYYEGQPQNVYRFNIFGPAMVGADAAAVVAAAVAQFLLRCCCVCRSMRCATAG
jgi:hypothetical protein